MNESRKLDLHVHIECGLADEYFVDWKTLTPAAQQFWNNQRETPHCEGSGTMGVHCSGCAFVKYFEVDED